MFYQRIWDQRGRSPVWYEGSRAPPSPFCAYVNSTALARGTNPRAWTFSLWRFFFIFLFLFLLSCSVLTELPVSPSSLGCASVWPSTAPSAGGVDTPSEVLGNTFFFLLLFLLCNPWSPASKQIQKWLICEEDYGLSHSIRIITEGF